ncbi:MFS transporter [Mangrovicoccus sp. HB161399]|uniref:MFS transporter n=1 Tax=Mangrovicoccus sp. HB161399 TaxID=2720392 RepID=UPI001551789F|nr:MFS transporter [Mangrovicoccus sp. HB161399]
MPADAPSRRWAIAAAAAAMLAIAMGQLVNGLSAFFEPLERAEGWSRGGIAFINTAGMAGLALGGAAMGMLADRISTRAVVLAGALSLGLALVAASFATALWQLWALFFLAGALGGGAMFAPLFALVGRWFATGAGLAIGLVSAGQALGQGGIPYANTLLIGALGWRGALLAAGLASLALLVPLALAMRDPAPAAAAGRAAEADGPPVATVTVLLSLAVICCCSLMAVPLMHLVPLVQGCGISGPEAGQVMLLMMLAAIGGRIAFGRLADRTGALPAYLIASAWQTLLVAGFAQLGDLGQFRVFAPVYGFGYAGVMTGVLTSIRTLIPARHRAGASGVVIAFAWLGHGLGGYMGGAAHDISGSYAAAFTLAAAAGVANLGLVAALWRLSRRPARPLAALPA